MPSHRPASPAVSAALQGVRVTPGCEGRGLAKKALDRGGWLRACGGNKGIPRFVQALFVSLPPSPSSHTVCCCVCFFGTPPPFDHHTAGYATPFEEGIALTGYPLVFIHHGSLFIRL